MYRAVSVYLEAQYVGKESVKWFHRPAFCILKDIIMDFLFLGGIFLIFHWETAALVCLFKNLGSTRPKWLLAVTLELINTYIFYIHKSHQTCTIWIICNILNVKKSNKYLGRRRKLICQLAIPRGHLGRVEFLCLKNGNVKKMPVSPPPKKNVQIFDVIKYGEVITFWPNILHCCRSF
jgi:hypothetical protein